MEIKETTKIKPSTIYMSMETNVNCNGIGWDGQHWIEYIHLQTPVGNDILNQEFMLAMGVVAQKLEVMITTYMVLFFIMKIPGGFFLKY